MADADRLIELFNEAKARPAGMERERFLAEACPGEPALKEQVTSLLQAHEGAGDFLKNTQVFSPTALVTEKPGDKIGRYKLLQQLGEGGWGVVYMAEQTEPVRRKVALKVIKLGMDTKQVVARFEAERQALALMDHPNIAKVFDAGATDLGRPYFVMELVKGIKITDYCDQNQLSTTERLDLFIQVCQAVQHAHQKGIIHRDLKPSNVLVAQHDTVAVPKVIDFGIAKATSDQPLTDKTVFTAFDQFMGTPAYMSPEQAQLSGLDIDTRTDIYSLGVLLYELLAGTTPFDPEELMRSGVEAMRKTIREQEPPRPSTRLSQTLVAADVRRRGIAGSARCPRAESGGPPDSRSTDLPPPRADQAKEVFGGPPKTTRGPRALPEETRDSSRRLLQLRERIARVRGDLDWIVMKCLEKDRTRRYETANGLAADLKRHLNNEPVVARPPSRLYEFQKTVRRHQFGFAATAAVLLALAGGVVVSTWQAIEASTARNAEKEQRLGAQTERDKARAAQEEAERAREAEMQERLRADAEKITAQRHLYVANMNLAQQAWERNHLGRLRQLLEETQEAPDRGFEWYYWQRQSHLALKTLRGHLRSVNAVAYSPDGQRIVTGSSDQTAKVWEAASGRELLTLRGHLLSVDAVAFSADGQKIVTGSSDQTAKVWEAASGKALLTLKGHREGIVSVAFSPDGQRIVTGSPDRTAKVWEATSGRELLTFKGHSNEVRSVAFSPDGQRIVTGSSDETARVWEAASGRELLTITGHSGWILSVAFSPDGQRIITASHHQTAKVWEAASGRELRTLEGHSGAIHSVAFSPDSLRIVTGSRDQTAKVWEAASGKALLTLKGHNYWIYSVAFSPDGQRIVTGSSDQTAKVWEAASDREQIRLKGHSLPLVCVVFSPDGQRIVSGSRYDPTAKVYEAASGKELLTLKGHSANGITAAFSPDGQRIVTGSPDQTGKVWDAVSGQEQLTLNGHTAGINAVAFSRDGQRIITGSSDRTTKVWEAASGKELLMLMGHSEAITSVAFSPGDQEIVTGSGDKTAKVWEAASGRELLTLQGHSEAITSVAFSPDGQRIVTGSTDDTAKVWEAASGRQLLTLQGHTEAILSVAFSPDGQRIITGGLDQTAKVWEATGGQALLTLQEHSGWIWSVAFSSDGLRIFTGSENYAAKVWKAAGAEQVAAWQAEERAAEQHRAAFQRRQDAEQQRQRIARSLDAGAIKRWLILAPIALASTVSLYRAPGLEFEQIEGEGGLRPKAGEARSIGSRELRWQAAALEDYVIDFNAFPGRETPRSAAYAVCYIRSKAEQRGLQILVGSEDHSKVYLNGKQVHESPDTHGFVTDQEMVRDIALNAGLNVLVFKVVSESLAWRGSIRFTDAQDNPVRGIRVTLDPDAKDENQ